MGVCVWRERRIGREHEQQYDVLTRAQRHPEKETTYQNKVWSDELIHFENLNLETLTLSLPNINIRNNINGLNILG